MLTTDKPKYIEVPSRAVVLSVEVGGSAGSVVPTFLAAYEKVCHMLSSKPLRRPSRTHLRSAAEDAADAALAKKALAEAVPNISWDEVKKDLGL